MNANGKMSLVVLRSWSDGPPKVRAIAPPDDDRSVYVPDHQGRFVTEEAKEEANPIRLHAGEYPRSASSASQYREFHRDGNHPLESCGKATDRVIYRKSPLQRCYANASTNRHSYSGAGANYAGFTMNLPKASSIHLPLEPVNSFGKESSSSRPDSVESPDNPDASSLEYTPPASPVNGRYRNLGPELAATIPKRTVRNSWIAEVKSRWNKSSSSNTTHPSSRVSSRHSAGSSKRASGSLKSYGSSPSLIYRNNKKSKSVGKRAAAGVSEEEEEGDYYDEEESYEIGGNEETPHHHRRSSLQRIHLDEEEADEEHQPFFNPLYKFGHSNNTAAGSPINNGTNENNHNANFALLRNNLKAAEVVAVHPSTNLVHRRSASGIALSVDDDSQSDRSRSSLGYPPSNNSGNTSYSPSPPPTANTPHDHIYSSLTDIHTRGRLDPFKLGDNSSPSNVVLVEVIRKQGNANDSKCNSTKSTPGGEKYKLEKFGSVELIQKIESTLSNGSANKGKRHSVGDIEPVVITNKLTTTKSDGSPGKVARLKESLKRFGRFGRSNTDKIIRTHSDSGFSTDEVYGDFQESSSTKHVPKDESQDDNNSSEIIVTSLDDTEKDSSITVKPAPRKRSKPLIKPENIYEVPITPESQHESWEQQTDKIIDERLTTPHYDHNLIKQDQLKDTTTSINDNDDSDRVSPIEQVETRIPHLEYDKEENEQSTSHDESSRAESLSYSTTSHEQDRSMPQQIVQQQHLLPKVDIVNGNIASSSVDEVGRADDTLNCEVTPVIRKRSFKKLNKDQNPSLKKPISKQISSSSVESDNQAGEEESTTKINGNKESESINQTLLVTPVTPDEHSAKENDKSNMNSFGRTRSKINSHENLNGHNNSDLKHSNIYNGNHDSGIEGPEIMTSTLEERSSDFNGVGKYENGTASVQVPVQAVNRHVLGYGLSNVDSITNNNLNDDHYSESIASTTSKNDSEWNQSSTRASLRGFCEDMLQQDKISIPVPDVVEAVINFDEDSSSIDQDEERENSIEYISVANVKVNREKRLEKLHPKDELPSCVIALDLGSRGSGYAYWIKEESEFVRIGNVDGVSSCPASHKAPSWVMFDDLYLDGDEDGESADSIRPGFGFQALDKYLTDDAHGQLSWRWREHFHEAKSFPYTLESKASDDDLIFMMKSAIRHYARQAIEQISHRRRGAPQGSTVTLIAIPSTFDQRARQLVREAALESGFLKESDSIALIEDSCASGLYALHTLKSKISKETNAKEISYLSVDCGASYLHFSGYQVTEGKLRQLLLPRSDPLIDSPESLFEAELSTVFTPNYIFNFQNKYKAGWLKLMTEFEHAKNRYDPLSRQNYYVFVPSSFVDHFRRFTSMEVEDALESSDMVWNKTGAIGIPHWKMQRFLQPLLDYVNDKVVTSMKKHKFEHLVLTGGRAGAKFYVDAITATAKGFGATLHVPKEYNAAVLQGSTISVTNLAPRLVIRSRFSIGVGVMTPFSEDIHPEEKRVMRDGKSWCADVWDSLIKADQELELNRVIIKRSYVGAQPGQSLLVLPLFKSPDEPKFVTESSVQKCCELKFTSGQRAWQEVELVLVCRPSELLIKAMDGGVMKSYVVVDFTD